MDIEKLLDLPFHVLMALSFGYIGYKIFSTGGASHHKTYDTIFLILIFSLPTFVIQKSCQGLSDLALGASGLIGTVIFAIILKYLMPHLQKIPRKIGASTENYHPTTWLSLINDRQNIFTVIAVRLEDGTWLESDLTSLPSNLPQYPCDLDVGGNIALYVTEKTSPEGDVTIYPPEGLWATDAGAGITYVPANQISRVMITKKTD